MILTKPLETGTLRRACPLFGPREGRVQRICEASSQQSGTHWTCGMGCRCGRGLGARRSKVSTASISDTTRHQISEDRNEILWGLSRPASPCGKRRVRQSQDPDSYKLSAGQTRTGAEPFRTAVFYLGRSSSADISLRIRISDTTSCSSVTPPGQQCSKSAFSRTTTTRPW